MNVPDKALFARIAALPDGRKLAIVQFATALANLSHENRERDRQRLPHIQHAFQLARRAGEGVLMPRLLRADRADWDAWADEAYHILKRLVVDEKAAQKKGGGYSQIIPRQRDFGDDSPWYQNFAAEYARVYPDARPEDAAFRCAFEARKAETTRYDWTAGRIRNVLETSRRGRRLQLDGHSNANIESTQGSAMKYVAIAAWLLMDPRFTFQPSVTEKAFRDYFGECESCGWFFFEPQRRGPESPWCNRRNASGKRYCDNRGRGARLREQRRPAKNPLAPPLGDSPKVNTMAVVTKESPCLSTIA